MKRVFAGLSLAVIFALVALIGFKLSQDAIAVIIGVGLGMLASIPTTLLLIFMLTRPDRQSANDGQHQPPQGTASHQPPVVIVNGGHQPGLRSGQQAPPYTMEIPNSRSFTIVGEETTEQD